MKATGSKDDKQRTGEDMMKYVEMREERGDRGGIGLMRINADEVTPCDVF